jgi:hypothetical protein
MERVAKSSATRKCNCLSDAKSDPLRSSWEQRGICQYTLASYVELPDFLLDLCRRAAQIAHSTVRPHHCFAQHPFVSAGAEDLTLRDITRRCKVSKTAVIRALK